MYGVLVLASAVFLCLVVYAWKKALARHAMNWRKRIDEADSKLRDLEILLLRNRLDAHFAFNALNTIVGNAGNPPAVLSVARGLSGYLAYSLGAADRLMVPFGEELDAVMAYLDVEKARFGESLEIQVDADFASRDAMVPGICLHHLVENAIKHGRKTIQPRLVIRIDATFESERFRLRVTNSGRWIPFATDPDLKTGGLGVGMVHRCLELLYAGRYRYSVGPIGGSVVAEIVIHDPSLYVNPVNGHRSNASPAINFSGPFFFFLTTAL